MIVAQANTNIANANTKSQFNPLWMSFGCGILFIYLVCIVSLLSLLLFAVAVIIVTVITPCVLCFFELYSTLLCNLLHKQSIHKCFAVADNLQRKINTSILSAHCTHTHTHTATIVYYDYPKYCGRCCNCPVCNRCVSVCVQYVENETKHKLHKNSIYLLFLETFIPNCLPNTVGIINCVADRMCSSMHELDRVLMSPVTHIKRKIKKDIGSLFSCICANQNVNLYNR